MSKKEEALRKLNDEQLLDIAGSVSESPAIGRTSRGELIRIIKENLSSQEIEDRVKHLGKETKTATNSRNELRLGGVGQIFLAASSSLASISSITFSPYMAWNLDYYRATGIGGIASSALVFIFAGLLGFSMFKVAARLKGNRAGKAASSLGFVAGLVGMAYYVSILLGITLVDYGDDYYGISALGVFIGAIDGALLGWTMMLLGAFFLLHYKHSVSSGLWLAAGIVYMIAGSVGFSNVMFTVIYPLMILASAMGATCFLMRESL